MSFREWTVPLLTKSNFSSSSHSNMFFSRSHLRGVLPPCFQESAATNLWLAQFVETCLTSLSK